MYTIETLHLTSIQNEQSRPSTSSGSSSGSEESGDEEDGALVTSEDAIYGEKVEPEFDLIKALLRTSYTESKNVKSYLEKNLELE